MNDYRQAMPAPKGRDEYRPRDCKEKIDRRSCFLINSQGGKDPFGEQVKQFEGFI
jgi:hypothetical protein